MSNDRQNVTFKDSLDHVAKEIPKYRRVIFKSIVTFMVIGKGRKCISGLFENCASLMMSIGITRKRFYLFLGSSKLPWQRILNVVVEMIRKPVQALGQRLVLNVDDTTYGKTGKKISGCNIHYDHAAKLNKSKWIFGHCRVVVGVMLFIHGRWACLPLLQRLYVPKKKEKIEKKQTDHDSKIVIAARLINIIRRLLDLPTLVICDSWFGTKPLMKLLGTPDLQAVHILSRLRVTCALFDFPEPPKPGKRGRKKKYGERLPPISELATMYNRKTIRAFVYGKYQQCTYSELTCMSQAMKTQIKVVFIHMGKGQDRFFPIFTTDLTLSAKEMIEYYAARWKIESGFKELKHELGALDNQARKEHAVENHFDLCCLAMTMTWIYALNQERAPHRKHPTVKANAYAFADIREQIRNEFQRPLNFSRFCPKTVKTAGNLILEHIFRQAA